MAEIVDNIFSRYGQPSAIIRGEEVSVAVMLGFAMAAAVLQFANGEEYPIYWRGPSIGVDTGGNAAKSFTLVYGASAPEDLHKAFWRHRWLGLFISAVWQSIICSAAGLLSRPCAPVSACGWV